MHSTNKIATGKDMLLHLLAGAGLGAALAVVLLMTNSGLVAMLAAHEAPGSLVIGFVLLSSSMIAVGSGITGFILSTLEKN